MNAVATLDRPGSESANVAHLNPLAAPSGPLRLVQVTSDNMQPTLRRTFDYVLVTDLRCYSGEGLYTFSNGGFGRECPESIYRVMGAGRGRFLLMSDLKVGERKIYTDHLVDLAEFDERITGKVVATVLVQDDHEFRMAMKAHAFMAAGRAAA